MNTKPLLALLAALPLLASFPASAVPSAISFADSDATVPYSWGSDGSPNNVTRTATLGEDWAFTGISWSGIASPNADPDFDFFGGTDGADLYVHIMVGAQNLGVNGNFQLGTGGKLLANTTFNDSAAFSSVSGLNGDTLSFRFFEQKDDWETIVTTIGPVLNPLSSYDALWNSITFNFTGSSIPFCTAHPNDPSCIPSPSPNPGSVPEPATLALLGLGLAGLGLMRRRMR